MKEVSRPLRYDSHRGNLTKRIERIIQGKLIQREQGERNLTKRIESDMDKRLRVGEAERLESHKEN